MFCLDYILAFAAHFGVNSLIFSQGQKCLERDCRLNPIQALATGAGAGAAAAVILYPFDFVRMATVGPGASHFAWSSIPFSAAYLGLYFSFRNQASLKSQSAWACTSMVIATAVEVPFDAAKRNMVAGGSLRNLIMTAGLRVPLGTFLLVVYDKILTLRLLAPRVRKISVENSPAARKIIAQDASVSKLSSPIHQ
jgi:hypothetical protein